MNTILNLQTVDASARAAEELRGSDSVFSSVSVSLCVVSLASVVLCMF